MECKNQETVLEQLQQVQMKTIGTTSIILKIILYSHKP